MTPYHQDDWLTVWQGDCIEVMAQMPAESVHTVVTSPPYWGLRDYGTATWLGGDESCDHKAPPKGGPHTASTLGPKRDGLGPDNAAWADSKREHQFRTVCGKCGAVRQDSQLGLEPTPEEYVANMVAVFREVRRVLRADGTCWVNLGDSYAAARGGTTMPAETLAGGVGGFTENGGRVNRDRHDGYSPSRNADKIGLKHKDLVGIPWRVAFALQADGWYLRSDIIWSKPNPMPESVTDRPTKSHEYLFLLAKSPRYFFDSDAVREDPAPQSLARISQPTFDQQTGGPKDYANGTNPNRSMRQTLENFAANPGRNLRSVWTIATQPYPGAHFATFPEKLVEPCVKAGSPPDGVVLDPFAGSGTTGRVAQRLGRRAVLIDLNADYLVQAMKRNSEIPLGLEIA